MAQRTKRTLLTQCFFEAVWMMAILIGLAMPAAAQSFQLSGIKFSPSEYLTDEDLQKTVAPYLNRNIEFSDVEAMLTAVQGLYLSKGIVTAQAVIEPQDVVDGTLRVTLVEALLDEVKYEGLSNTKPDFLSRRLTMKRGSRPNFDDLARDLRLFEITHDIRPKLSFSPGEDPGTTTMTVTVDEPKRFSWIISADNSASEALGENQLSFTGTVRSLTGHRDTLSAKLAITQGSEAISLFYNRPVGVNGAKLSFSGSYASTRIVRGEFQIINVESDDVSLSAGYSRPFWVKRDRYWTVSADLNYEDSSSTVSGTDLQSSTLSEIDLGFSYNQQKPGQAWSISGGLRYGTVNSGSVSTSDGTFSLLYGNVNYARRLGTRFLFDANMDFQYAEGQNLSVRRRFSGGGIATLRGYEKDVRSGDSGAILQLQVTCPAPCMGQKKDRKLALSPFAFMDLGYIKPFEASLTDVDRQNQLASAGFGVRANFNKFSLLGFVGAPLIQPEGLTNTSPRAYFGADYSF